MSERRIEYHFAVLRVVPHVHTGAFANVGVVLHARTVEYLDMHAITDRDAIRRIAPGIDVDMLLRYLDCYHQICRGDERAGPLALVSQSERFHWLSAPRSDVIQPAPVHEGTCADPDAELAALYRSYVAV